MKAFKVGNFPISMSARPRLRPVIRMKTAEGATTLAWRMNSMPLSCGMSKSVTMTAGARVPTWARASRGRVNECTGQSRFSPSICDSKST